MRQALFGPLFRPCSALSCSFSDRWASVQRSRAPVGPCTRSHVALWLPSTVIVLSPLSRFPSNHLLSPPQVFPHTSKASISCAMMLLPLIVSGSSTETLQRLLSNVCDVSNQLNLIG